MPTTWEVFVQSALAFASLLVLARLMGKRQVAHLTFFDYVVGITIGNIAASWSLDETRSVHAAVCLGIWAGLPLLLSLIQRKSYRGRILLDGRPTVMVEHGKVLEDNLRRERLSIEELMLMLRDKDVFKLSDVEYAVLETNGKLSVQKKSEWQPLTPQVAGIPVPPEGVPKLVVIDGHVMERTLRDLGYSREWLLGELMKQGAQDFTDVFVAQVDSHGNVYADLYNESMKKPEVKQRPLLAATLKKIQADLEQFALETQNQSAKQLYAAAAAKLKAITDSLLPYLKE